MEEHEGPVAPMSSIRSDAPSLSLVDESKLSVESGGGHISKSLASLEGRDASSGFSEADALEMLALKAIVIREGLRTRLHRYVRRVERTPEMLTDETERGEILGLAYDVRLASVRVVETIQAWRAAVVATRAAKEAELAEREETSSGGDLGAELARRRGSWEGWDAGAGPGLAGPPFKWQGEDYLGTMLSDLGFLGENASILKLFRLKQEDMLVNPLLGPKGLDRSRYMASAHDRARGNDAKLAIPDTSPAMRHLLATVRTHESASDLPPAERFAGRGARARALLLVQAPLKAAERARQGAGAGIDRPLSPLVPSILAPDAIANSLRSRATALALDRARLEQAECVMCAVLAARTAHREAEADALLEKEQLEAAEREREKEARLREEEERVERLLDQEEEEERDAIGAIEDVVGAMRETKDSPLARRSRSRRGQRSRSRPTSRERPRSQERHDFTDDDRTHVRRRPVTASVPPRKRGRKSKAAKRKKSQQQQSTPSSQTLPPSTSSSSSPIRPRRKRGPTPGSKEWLHSGDPLIPTTGIAPALRSKSKAPSVRRESKKARTARKAKTDKVDKPAVGSGEEENKDTKETDVLKEEGTSPKNLENILEEGPTTTKKTADDDILEEGASTTKKTADDDILKEGPTTIEGAEEQSAAKLSEQEGRETKEEEEEEEVKVEEEEMVVGEDGEEGKRPGSAMDESIPEDDSFWDMDLGPTPEELEAMRLRQKQRAREAAQRVRKSKGLTDRSQLEQERNRVRVTKAPDLGEDVMSLLSGRAARAIAGIQRSVGPQPKARRRRMTRSRQRQEAQDRHARTVGGPNLRTMQSDRSRSVQRPVAQRGPPAKVSRAASVTRSKTSSSSTTTRKRKTTPQPFRLSSTKPKKSTTQKVSSGATSSQKVSSDASSSHKTNRRSRSVPPTRTTHTKKPPASINTSTTTDPTTSPLRLRSPHREDAISALEHSDLPPVAEVDEHKQQQMQLQQEEGQEERLSRNSHESDTELKRIEHKVEQDQNTDVVHTNDNDDRTSPDSFRPLTHDTEASVERSTSPKEPLAPVLVKPQSPEYQQNRLQRPSSRVHFEDTDLLKTTNNNASTAAAKVSTLKDRSLSYDDRAALHQKVQQQQQQQYVSERPSSRGAVGHPSPVTTPRPREVTEASRSGLPPRHEPPREVRSAVTVARGTGEVRVLPPGRPMYGGGGAPPSSYQHHMYGGGGVPPSSYQHQHQHQHQHLQSRPPAGVPASSADLFVGDGSGMFAKERLEGTGQSFGSRGDSHRRTPQQRFGPSSPEMHLYGPLQQRAIGESDMDVPVAVQMGLRERSAPEHTNAESKDAEYNDHMHETVGPAPDDTMRSPPLQELKVGVRRRALGSELEAALSMGRRRGRKEKRGRKKKHQRRKHRKSSRSQSQRRTHPSGDPYRVRRRRKHHQISGGRTSTNQFSGGGRSTPSKQFSGGEHFTPSKQYSGAGRSTPSKQYSDREAPISSQYSPHHTPIRAHPSPPPSASASHLLPPPMRNAANLLPVLGSRDRATMRRQFGRSPSRERSHRLKRAAANATTRTRKESVSPSRSRFPGAPNFDMDGFLAHSQQRPPLPATTPPVATYHPPPLSRGSMQTLLGRTVPTSTDDIFATSLAAAEPARPRKLPPINRSFSSSLPTLPAAAVPERAWGRSVEAETAAHATREFERVFRSAYARSFINNPPSSTTSTTTQNPFSSTTTAPPIHTYSYDHRPPTIPEHQPSTSSSYIAPSNTSTRSTPAHGRRLFDEFAERAAIRAASMRSNRTDVSNASSNPPLSPLDRASDIAADITAEAIQSTQGLLRPSSSQKLQRDVRARSRSSSRDLEQKSEF